MILVRSNECTYIQQYKDYVMVLKQIMTFIISKCSEKYDNKIYKDIPTSYFSACFFCNSNLNCDFRAPYHNLNSTEIWNHIIIHTARRIFASYS